METTKEKRDFSSLSDSIVMLITTKHKEIEAEAKQLLGLKEEELERKNKELAERSTRLERKSKELVERSTRLESDKEKLGLREKQVEQRWRELEMHAVEIDEDRYTVAEQLRELELKDLQFKQREEVFESRCKDIEWRRIELERILEKFEVDKKKLEERIHEIDRKEKQMEGRIKRLDLLSKDLERQSRELDSNQKKSDERMHKLDQKERQLDERVQLFESSKRRLDADWKKLDFRIREVNCREKELDRGLEQLKLKENSLDMKSKEIDRILEKFEVDKKKLVEQMEGRKKGLDLQSKDLERQRSELDSDRKKSDERMHKLDQRERQLEFDRGKVSVDSKILEYQIREANRRKIELDKGLEQVRLKENLLDMNSKDIELKRNCKEIVMDGKTLQIFLNERSQNHEKMGDEVSFLLKLSQDPAKLVLDALEGFFPPHLRRNGNGEEFSGHIVQRSCILLLEQLLKMSHDIKIKPEVKKEARRLSCVWITKLKPESEHPMDILGFLLVLAIYDVVSVFSADEIFNYVKTVSHFEQLPELCCLLGMTDKITGLIQDLVERKQHLVAIRYAYDYNLIEKFPLGSLLKDHVETSRIESAAIIKSGNKSRIAQSQARTRMISNLTAAITCIEKYNISSEYSPANLRQMIASLYKHDKEEQKETDFHAPAAAVGEVSQLQQTGTCSSVPSSSIGPKAVVSDHVWTDPLPKRRKLLDGKSILMKHAHFKPEKQVCGNERI